MNADGSRGVTVAVRFGARFSSLGWVVTAVLAAGGLVLIVGAGLRPEHNLHRGRP